MSIDIPAPLCYLSPVYRGTSPSKLLLGLYVVCMLLVFSFILFEVLDVDGSDFPQPATRSVRLTTQEAQSHDIRRVLSQFYGPLDMVDVCAPLCDDRYNATAFQLSLVAPPPVSAHIRSRHPVTLARSLLGPVVSA